MIAISVWQYPTTSWDGWMERAMAADDVDFSGSRPRLVPPANKAASATHGAAAVTLNPAVGRRRRANPEQANLATRAPPPASALRLPLRAIEAIETEARAWR